MQKSYRACAKAESPGRPGCHCLQFRADDRLKPAEHAGYPTLLELVARALSRLFATAAIFCQNIPED